MRVFYLWYKDLVEISDFDQLRFATIELQWRAFQVFIKRRVAWIQMMRWTGC